MTGRITKRKYDRMIEKESKGLDGISLRLRLRRNQLDGVTVHVSKLGKVIAAGLGSRAEQNGVKGVRGVRGKKER